MFSSPLVAILTCHCKLIAHKTQQDLIHGYSGVLLAVLVDDSSMHMSENSEFKWVTAVENIISPETCMPNGKDLDRTVGVSFHPTSEIS